MAIDPSGHFAISTFLIGLGISAIIGGIALAIAVVLATYTGGASLILV